MINKILEDNIKKNLEILIQEFNSNMSSAKIKMLQNTNVKNLYSIENTNTISLFVQNNKIYYPKEAINALELLSTNPDFGKNKNHKAYTNENLIINDNTFSSYVNHAILKGLKPIDYYLENTLHECCHLIGIVGASAIGEGITELKTRQIAKKYNVITSGCGYPKEVFIAYQLEQILGKEIIEKIMFIDDLDKQVKYIKEKLGANKANLYYEVYQKTNKIFKNYINNNYSGTNAIQDKISAYDKLNYDEILKIINDFQESN